MMTANKDRISLEHDTTMCGDPKVWFPMRVTYQREMKVKAELDRLEIETFVPMVEGAKGTRSISGSWLRVNEKGLQENCVDRCLFIYRTTYAV